MEDAVIIYSFSAPHGSASVAGGQPATIKPGWNAQLSNGAFG
jgi:hypothetical protein